MTFGAWSLVARVRSTAADVRTKVDDILVATLREMTRGNPERFMSLVLTHVFKDSCDRRMG